MTPIALFVEHKTLPGKRGEVCKVWERHMAPAIAGDPGHSAYFYCFDNSEVDSICAFQLYASSQAAEDFLKTPSYGAI